MAAVATYGPVGILPTPSVAFQIERAHGPGLKVESVTFDVDDYFPGHNGFGGRVELLSGAKYPACAEVALMTNAASYVPPVDRKPDDVSLVSCDGRWVASDYQDVQRVWPALRSDWLEATVYGEPRIPDNYSFYDFTSQSFHESPAVSFNGVDKVAFTPFEANPAVSSPAMLAMFVLSAGSPAYELMSWKFGEKFIVVQVRPGQILTSVTEGGQVTGSSKITLAQSDIGVPSAVGLRYNDDTLTLETFLKRGGKLNPASVSKVPFRMSGTVSCEWVLFPGDWERGVEVLDVSLWRGNCTDAVLQNAISGYSRGYGI